MRQFLDHLAAEEAGAAFDRVHGSKQTVDPFAIGIARVLLQRQQILHEANQVFLGLCHEFVEGRRGNRRRRRCSASFRKITWCHIVRARDAVRLTRRR